VLFGSGWTSFAAVFVHRTACPCCVGWREKWCFLLFLSCFWAVFGKKTESLFTFRLLRDFLQVIHGFDLKSVFEAVKMAFF
jgi:hypothetical protein